MDNNTTRHKPVTQANQHCEEHPTAGETRSGLAELALEGLAVALREDETPQQAAVFAQLECAAYLAKVRGRSDPASE